MISHGAWCRCTECTAPSERCQACQQGPLECRCVRWCQECGCRTNHSTEQHHDAVADAALCVSCGALPKMDDDPDTKWCYACWQEEQAYKFADWCDRQGKELE